MSKKESVVRIRKLNQQFTYTSLQLHEAIARRAGLAGTDQKYLGFFIQRGSLTAGEIATLTGLTTGAVTGLIDRLEKKKLVKRQFDKADRRRVIVVPDKERIERFLQPLYQQFQEETDQMISTFTITEMKTIEKFLKKSIALIGEKKDQLER